MSYRFGSDRPKIDTRIQGAGKYTAPTGTSQHYFTIPFDCLLNGVQLYAKDSNVGDTVSFEVQYDYGGVWKRYKKFGKGLYFPPNAWTEFISVPAEPKQGMRLEFEYVNTGSTSVDFTVNALTYSPQTVIDVASGAEGEDW